MNPLFWNPRSMLTAFDNPQFGPPPNDFLIDSAFPIR